MGVRVVQMYHPASGATAIGMCIIHRQMFHPSACVPPTGQSVFHLYAGMVSIVSNMDHAHPLVDTGHETHHNSCDH
jgi:hypothetical protein